MLQILDTSFISCQKFKNKNSKCGLGFTDISFHSFILALDIWTISFPKNFKWGQEKL